MGEIWKDALMFELNSDSPNNGLMADVIARSDEVTNKWDVRFIQKSFNRLNTILISANWCGKTLGQVLRQPSVRFARLKMPSIQIWDIALEGIIEAMNAKLKLTLRKNYDFNENDYLVDKWDILVGSALLMWAELNFEEFPHIRDTHKDADKEWLQCLLVRTCIWHILAWILSRLLVLIHAY